MKWPNPRHYSSMPGKNEENIQKMPGKLACRWPSSE